MKVRIELETNRCKGLLKITRATEEPKGGKKNEKEYL